MNDPVEMSKTHWMAFLGPIGALAVAFGFIDESEATTTVEALGVLLALPLTHRLYKIVKSWGM